MIKSISISNYRSIKELTIPITKVAGKTCNVYIGKNESGKSTILKAISLLNPATKYSYIDDCNKEAKKKKDNIYIEFEIDLDELKNIDKEIKQVGLPKDLIDSIEITGLNRRIDIDNISRDDDIGIDIEPREIFDEYLFNELNSEFIRIADIYSGSEIITRENIAAVVGPHYKMSVRYQIEVLLQKRLYQSVDKQLPKCIFWESTDEYLINNTINLIDFSKNPDISIPLRNIFYISGIFDIKSRIDLIKDDIEERAQLKEDLSGNITKYINGIWPEHQINIRIEIEAISCSVMVEDKDHSSPKYKMQQRSDGFKQFISILLNLSIENSTRPQNNIILMDEPEVHLHPSGIKYMRDELLNIAQKNIVFISTHSTYMVDKLNLERHFKVSKEKSNTSVKQIDASNPYEEEVIYEALGTSIYEHINPNVIVFEGKIDKDIFDVFTEKYKADWKPVLITSISADGVDKIPQYCKFITGTFVNGYVVVDSDADGMKNRAQIIKENKAFTENNTLSINDLFDTKKSATIEDLYPRELIESALFDMYKMELAFDDSPVMKQIDLKNKSLNKVNSKDLKSFLVKKIIADLSSMSKANAKDKYLNLYTFVANLNNHIKSKSVK